MQVCTKIIQILEKWLKIYYLFHSIENHNGFG